MAGSLMASEAVSCVLHRQKHAKGTLIEVGLSQAVSYLARPRTSFDMQHPKALTGGGHVGYRVYACKDGRVALAALEPHFYQRVCAEAGIDPTVPDSILLDSSRRAIEKWLWARRGASTSWHWRRTFRWRPCPGTGHRNASTPE